MIKRMTLAGFFGAAAIWSGPCLADGAIAIGDAVRSSGNFSWGASYGEPADQAGASALRICRGQGPEYNGPKAGTTEAQRRCSAVATLKDQCGAVAWNGKSNSTKRVTGYGWAIAADSNTAERQAIAQCETMRAGRGDPCKISAHSFCDGSAK